MKHRTRGAILAAACLAPALAGACSASKPTTVAASHRGNAVATSVPLGAEEGGPGSGAPSTVAIPSTTTSPPSTASTGVAPPGLAGAPPPFSDTVSSVTTAQLSGSWHAGCPVGADQLRMITMDYWGFDGRSHTGHLVVNASVVDPVVSVFQQLYDARFPITEMIPENGSEGPDPANWTADNTEGFSCRDAVGSGPASWSMHAYGEAIDVNPVENPYVENGQVIPYTGAPYLDRSNVRPGMAEPGGVLVNAFTSIGWGWGGTWSDSPDYQHFSTNGT